MISDSRMKDLSDFCRRSGLSFKNLTLLDQALTHSSWVTENGGASNERLEFLGDAFLQNCVSSWLYHRFPQATEGELTCRRSHMVCTATLAGLGRDLGLPSLLRIGASVERPSEKMIADSFEALTAALYLDGGPDAAASLVERTHAYDQPLLDPKSEMNKRATALGQLLDLETRRVSGPDHAPQYEALLRWNGRGYHGIGRGKREAEQAACRAALEDL